MSLPLRHGLWLALFAFVGFWLNSWAVPLFDLDEGAFTEATREMFARGDFLMTYLDGAPRYDKPILVYWLQAASVSTFGWNEFALRLPSMLAASGWMWAVYRFTGEVALAAGRAPEPARGAALFAAAALALSPIPGVIGHAATADALLNLWLALTLLDLWRWLTRQASLEAARSRPHWKDDVLLLVYLWIGLGLLTKGPVAVALPVMVALPFALLYRRWRDLLKAALFWPGWLVTLAVFLPWAVALTLRDGGDFFRHFLLDHNVSRYSATMESHGGHWWYYAVALPFIVLPFAAWLAPALGAVRRWRSEPVTSYLLIWFGVVFLLFSGSQTQLPHYLLYGCTPLFVLMGLHRNHIRRKWLALAPTLVFLLVLAALPLILQSTIPDAEHPYDRGIVEAVLAAIGPGYWVVCLGALALVILSLWHRRLDGPSAAIRAGIAVSVTAWCGVLPLLAAGQQRPVQEAAAKARALDLPTVSYRIHMPSFSVYRGAVTPQRTPVSGELAFTRLDRLQDLGRETGRPFTVVQQSGGMVLVRIE